ncbi:condensation domain-containing protein [Streptomyces sp. NPDC058622]|uniref:condensation domain-containing protein n=1 Tax=Streptomyces sp. NPDC058622 TaxID=3346562 RepID=UPI0036509102
MNGTLVRLLRERADKQGADTAFRFLADDGPRTVTYGGLETGARAVAARLQQEGTAAGDRVLLLYPPGLDYVTAFFGCLYAGAVPVPAYPPSSLSTVGKLAAVALDSGAAVALTTAAIVPVLERGVAGTPLAALRAVATDVLEPGLAAAWRTHDPEPGATAFLQYTSGSTAAPKGVVVTHANLLHNMDMISRAFGVTAASRAVVWLPPYHDMGLIGGILTPLYGGFPVTLMSPMNFLRRPLQWLRAISDERADVSGGPNFAYEMCVRAVTDADRDGLDLSSWKVAFNGAEPIRPETLDAFTEAFGDCGFRRSSFLPCYGLAEATLFVTGTAAHQEPAVRAVDPAALQAGRADAPAPGAPGRTLVGSGRAFAGQDVRVVSPETLRTLPDLEVGEIWVRGASVTAGYFGNPGQTAEAFGAVPAGVAGAVPAGVAGAVPAEAVGAVPAEERPDQGYLRTGDLGFLDDGELYVTGRRKDLIIIRGRNFYPTDIERAADHSHPGLRKGCGAAFAVEHDGTQAVVLVQEVDGRAVRGLDGERAVAAVRAAVAEQCEVALHDVVLVKPGSIPKTTSGKIQRRLTRKRYTAGEFEPLWAGGSGPAGGDAATPDAAAPDASAPDAAAPDASAPDRAAFAALDPAGRTRAVRSLLVRRVAGLTGVPAGSVDLDRPVGAAGLDSLGAVRLANTARDELGAILPLSELLGGATLAEAAAAAFPDDAPEARRDTAAAAPLGPRAAPGEVTPGQHAVWQAHQEDPGGAAYTIAIPFRLHGPLDADALRSALSRLTRRHAVLRTTYRVQDGRPVPVTADTAEAVLTRADARDWDERQVRDRLTEAAHAPFDLERGPVLRALLLTRPDSTHLLLLTLHHIAGDLWSAVLLTDELGRLYREEAAEAPVPAEAPGTLEADQAADHGYADHVAHRAALLAGPAGDRMRAYWEQRLAGATTVLELPTDAPRPAVADHRAGRRAFTLAPEFTGRLRAFAAERGVTLYSLLLAAFHITLHHAGGQDDVIVGSPAANRGRRADEDVIGYFVNPLPVRASFAPGDTPATLLGRLHADVVRDLDHQAYPLPLVLEHVRPRRAPGRNPLFQAAFLFQKPHTGQASAPFVLGVGSDTVAWGGLEAAPLAVEQHTAPYELMLTLVDTGAALHGSLHHSTDVYAGGTAERLAAHFRQTLADLLTRPDTPVAELCPPDLLARRTAAAAVGTAAADDGHTPPRNETERILAAIWEDILDVEPVGAHDDFFDLGGHSLLAAQLISAVRDAFGVEVPVRAVMQSRTLAESAAFVDALVWARESAAAQDTTTEAGAAGPDVREEGEL